MSMEIATKTGHWLLITSRGSWAHLCAREEWAFTDKSRRLTEKIRLGDHGIVYLRNEEKSGSSALGGIVGFSGAPFRLTGGSMFDQLFPVRLPIRVNYVLKEPVPFRPLVQRIDFMKHKINWGSYLQGHAAIELAEKDYRTMIEAIMKSGFDEDQDVNVKAFS